MIKKERENEMKKLWIYTTFVLGLQCIVGGGVYAITGDFRTASTSAALAALAAAFALFAAAFVSCAFTSRVFALIIPAAFAACATAIAVLALRTATSSVVSTVSLLVLVALMTAVASSTAKDEGAKEPFWVMWLTALPVVGTVWGIGLFSTRFLLGLIRGQNRGISA
ncbi:MAG: hypothetical protein QY304_00560 [Candidatus Paceibacterota bacterium]|nr:MAG: hypothetical protein QY304_00560 [Candidatus Paceibacterota bacterium]